MDIPSYLELYRTEDCVTISEIFKFVSKKSSIINAKGQPVSINTSVFVGWNVKGDLFFSNGLISLLMVGKYIKQKAVLKQLGCCLYVTQLPSVKNLNRQVDQTACNSAQSTMASNKSFTSA